MTVRYYKYSRNARAAARRIGLDPDVVVQPAPAGFYSVDFGDIEPTEPEPQGDGEPQETVAVEPQPEESEPVVEDKPAPDMAELYKDIASGEFKEVFGEPTALDVALANAHLDGIPACLQRAPESAEETAAREERLAHYAKGEPGARARRAQDQHGRAEGGKAHQDRRRLGEGQRPSASPWPRSRR